jgi:hypothetical protein
LPPPASFAKVINPAIKYIDICHSREGGNPFESPKKDSGQAGMTALHCLIAWLITIRH